MTFLFDPAALRCFFSAPTDEIAFRLIPSLLHTSVNIWIPVLPFMLVCRAIFRVMPPMLFMVNENYTRELQQEEGIYCKMELCSWACMTIRIQRAPVSAGQQSSTSRSGCSCCHRTNSSPRTRSCWARCARRSSPLSWRSTCSAWLRSCWDGSGEPGLIRRRFVLLLPLVSCMLCEGCHPWPITVLLVGHFEVIQDYKQGCISMLVVGRCWQ